MRWRQTSGGAEGGARGTSDGRKSVRTRIYRLRNVRVAEYASEPPAAVRGHTEPPTGYSTIQLNLLHVHLFKTIVQSVVTTGTV